MRVVNWFTGIAASTVLAAVFAVYSLGQSSPPPSPDSPVVKIVLPMGHGSGVHLGNGYILTANHVVKVTGDIKIKTTSGRLIKAEVLWGNEPYDIAMIRVGSFDNLAASKLSCREPFVGEVLKAKGAPSDLEFMTTIGFTAGPVQEWGAWRAVNPVDLTIVPGMSGGPVYDNKQQVVGISVLTMVQSMGGFVPSWVRFGGIVPGSIICELMGRNI